MQHHQVTDGFTGMVLSGGLAALSYVFEFLKLADPVLQIVLHYGQLAAVCGSLYVTYTTIKKLRSKNS